MNDDGRLKLSWAQIVWGIATLVAIIGAWYDLRFQNRVVAERLAALEKQTLAATASAEGASTEREDISWRISQLEMAQKNLAGAVGRIRSQPSNNRLLEDRIASVDATIGQKSDALDRRLRNIELRLRLVKP